MKKLELRDIAGYLPHGLKVLRPDQITILEMRGLLGTLVQHEEKGEITYSSLSGCRPILRPMSDLTREITHKGKKFVPERVLEWESRNGEYGRVIDFGDNHSGCILPWDCLNELDLLNEWMFDYRDLIGQGLAIDVNTLKENCYE